MRLRTGQGPDNPAAAEWFVEEIEGSEFARIRHVNTGLYLALQPSAGGPAVGDSIGVEDSSSGDVNQVWRIEQLEDGDQGVPVPLLAVPGQFLLLGSLLAGAFRNLCPRKPARAGTKRADRNFKLRLGNMRSRLGA